MQSLFSLLRRSVQPDGYYHYGQSEFLGRNANSMPLETAIAPVEPLAPGERQFQYLSLAPAVDFQPIQIVENGLPELNDQQFVDDPLLNNDDPRLQGVLPYY